MIPNLEPNTRYEFVVRLHLDQISSPWSSVVYHQTLPAGNETIRIHLFVFVLVMTEIVTKLFMSTIIQTKIKKSLL